MSTLVTDAYDPSFEEIESRLESSLQHSRGRQDQMFAWLLLFQCGLAILLAAFISPLTWEGVESAIHPHLIAAVVLGGLITGYPVYLGFAQRGQTLTRYSIAVAQMLMSALLIHLSGGRIETHFHIFASLALLAFYRDYRILLVAMGVVLVDHVIRGVYWPRSVFGNTVEYPVVRAFEHAAWVFMEVVALGITIYRSKQESRETIRRQIKLENTEEILETMVEQRTKALRDSEKKAQELFNNAAVGLYHCNGQGRLLSVNPAMVELLGYKTSVSLRNSVQYLEQIATEDSKPHGTWLAGVMENGGYRLRDSVWMRQDGTCVNVRESTKVIYDEQGTPCCIEGSVEDLTEIRQLEERFLQSQKVQALGQLSTGIAHDFNNVLTSIIGFSELIESGGEATDTIRDHVSEIRKSADRAASLTAQLLAFSRKQTFQPEAFQLDDTVRDMRKLIERLVGENIALDFKFQSGAPAAYGDPKQIQQVVLNLAVNARDAMGEEGKLTVEVQKTTLDQNYVSYCGRATAGEYILLAVSDTGCGIPRNKWDRIFEPFFTTKGPAGTGLGLATCMGIVKHSGGHMTLYSEEGVGTTFKVYLPVAESGKQVAEVSKDEAEPERPAIRGHEVILIAEDEAVVRSLGVRALSSLGYQVIEAINGADALDKFQRQYRREESISLVITDVMMPGMGGVELASHLREIAPDIPIIYSSGYTDEAITNTDLLERGSYFIQKPYSIANLGRKVREVLDASGGESGDSCEKAA